MLAGEVDVPLPHLLVAAESRVLTRLPVRVRAQEVRIGERRRQHRLAVPLRRDPGEDHLQLREVLLRERRHRLVRGRRRVRIRLPHRLSDVCARVLDEDPGRARLRPRHVPAALDRQVGVERARAPLCVPET